MYRRSSNKLRKRLKNQYASNYQEISQKVQKQKQELEQLVDNVDEQLNIGGFDTTLQE